MINIVALDTITFGTDNYFSKISNLGNLICYRTTYNEEVYERIKDAHIVITNKVKIKKEHLEKIKTLRLILVTASVVDIVDTNEAESNNVEIKYFPNYATNSVAQFTFAMLMQLTTRVSYFDEFVKSGSYSRHSSFTHLGEGFSELKDKTFGIIGMGHIGSKVAEIAFSFGCKVIYYNRSLKNNLPNYNLVSFKDLVEESDIISIHLPLTVESENLFDRVQFKKMKSNAIILNTGRGGIINEIDLVAAIDSDEIYGACLDVYAIEPLPIDSPLLKINNKNRLVLTPHCGWSSLEGRSNLFERIYLEMLKFITTKNIEND